MGLEARDVGLFGSDGFGGLFERCQLHAGKRGFDDLLDALRAEFGLAPGATLLVRAEPPGLRLATPGGLIARQQTARHALERRLAEA